MAAKDTPQRQPIRAQDVGEEVFNATATLWRWLVLVAAIAVGSCLGIALFAMVAVLISAGTGTHAVIHFTPFTTTTTAPNWPRSP
jgi:hypothetical protein